MSSASVARDQLRSFVERIERTEEEKKALTDDVRDIYGEAKGAGYDTRALRKIVRMRKLDIDERLNQEHLINTYMAALDMRRGETGEDVDQALDRRRSDAGKAKTGRQPRGDTH